VIFHYKTTAPRKSVDWGVIEEKEVLLLVAYSDTEMVDSLSMSPFLSLIRSNGFPYCQLVALKHLRDSYVSLKSVSIDY
jgi:hypothetical protein